MSSASVINLELKFGTYVRRMYTVTCPSCTFVNRWLWAFIQFNREEFNIYMNVGGVETSVAITPWSIVTTSTYLNIGVGIGYVTSIGLFLYWLSNILI